MKVQVGMPKELLSFEELEAGSATDRTLTAAIEVLVDPFFVLFTEGDGPGRDGTAVFSLGRDFATTALAFGDDSPRFAPITLDSIPHVIAIIEGLGPTPHYEREPEKLATADFMALLETTPETLGYDQSDVLGGVFTTPWSAWTLAGMAPGDSEPSGLLRVVGSKEKGWWKLEEEEGEEDEGVTSALPTTSWEVWQETVQLVQALQKVFL